MAEDFDIEALLEAPYNNVSRVRSYLGVTLRQPNEWEEKNAQLSSVVYWNVFM